MEGLANQPDVERADAVARSLLDDADPMVRSQAAGMVSFRARPGALEVLLPLADDPVPHVRMVLGWYLGGLRDRAAEPTLRALLADPDEQVRKFAARGLARLTASSRPLGADQSRLRTTSAQRQIRIPAVSLRPMAATA
ncbi:hypothetical protein GCM10022255_007190 [Dactylosporangium darangshiense]|uniref:HEAT repeat domain-containing protein n=1 Tax=Dactylosporangium darangshiense TaxID=579108 RepID=A0ABP8CX29_9ACTN